MWESNHSGTESLVKWGNVTEDSNEGGFEEETEVTEVVDHALLGKGKVSSLADHQISPLDAHDRYEIAGLSAFKGLGRVANIPVLGGHSVHVEVWCSFCRWGSGVPSACSPSVSASVVCIVKSDIYSSVLGLVPSNW
jgi:hypothetical protein